MRIAVDAAFFNPSELGTLLKLAASHQEDDFLFIVDEASDNKVAISKNVSIKKIAINPNSTFSLKIRYNLRIPIALNRHKPQIVISKNCISGRAKIPQLLFFQDLNSVFQSPLYKKSTIRFFKKNISACFNNAAQIITNSGFEKKEITTRFKLNEEKVKVLYPEIEKKFIELNFEERQTFKEKYAEGNEYFAYSGAISPQQNLLNLLKAFSFFKKRQKSKMQFIIIGKRGINYEDFAESLRLFRFKDDVKILENLSQQESEKLIASSYAMLYLPDHITDPDKALEAMRIGVPVIGSSTGIMRELYADAAIYAVPSEYRDIAEKMMLLFKDEKMRKQLIAKQEAQSERFIQNHNEQILYEIIQNTITKNPLK